MVKIIRKKCDIKCVTERLAAVLVWKLTELILDYCSPAVNRCAFLGTENNCSKGR